MNDPNITATKFVELSRLAGVANTDFEKAAVFAAAEALAAQFNVDEEGYSAFAMECVASARLNICAAVGYAAASTHDRGQHAASALAAAIALRGELKKRGV